MDYENMATWRIIFGALGVIIVWVTGGFWWKTIGIMLIFIVCLAPRAKRKKFRKYE